MFRNREAAGRRLATVLSDYAGTDAVVLALPRGGVPVGFEVARARGASYVAGRCPAVSREESLMLVNEVMTSPAITVRERTPAKEALALLDRHSITMLPVVTGDRHLVGVVSEADLIRDGVPSEFAPSWSEAESSPPPPHTVGEVMTPHPLAVSCDADLAATVDLMITSAVKSVPVMDHHRRVAGVVSRRDIVHLVARPDEQIERDVDETYRRLSLDWLVDVQDGLVTVTGPINESDRDLAAAAASKVPGVVAVAFP